MAAVDGASGSSRFLTLDGMRGVAAIGVVLLHADALSIVSVPGGYLAVDLFLVLSGFVISHAYRSRIPHLGTLGFMRVRLVRLYPLYFAGLVLGIFAAILQSIYKDSSLPVGAILTGLVLLPMPSMAGYLYPLNPPAWSLGFEALVNWLFGLLGGRMSNWLCFGAMAISATVIAHSSLGQGHANLGADWPNFVVGLARATYSFTAGVVLFQYFSSRPKVTRRGRILPLVVILLLIPILAFSPEERAWWDLTCIFVLFPILVIMGASLEPSYSRIFGLLGDTSYALYCIHFPLLLIGRAVIIRTEVNVQIAGMALLLAILVFAFLVHHKFDIPVRAWLSGRLLPARTLPSPV